MHCSARRGVRKCTRPRATAWFSTRHTTLQSRYPIFRTGPHLPGGGVDPGETHREALRREIVEEVAHEATIGDELGRADVYADSHSEGACFLKQGTFFVATLGAHLPELEPEHEMEWMTPEQFLRESPDPTHTWALRRALQGES